MTLVEAAGVFALRELLEHGAGQAGLLLLALVGAGILRRLG